MDDWEDVIIKETEKCAVTTLGSLGKRYKYAILPLESNASPEYLTAIKEGMEFASQEELKNVDAIVGIEAKGFIPASLLAEGAGKRLVTIRKRDYKTPDQLIFEHETAYGEKEQLFCASKLLKGKVLIEEDMISSGNTVISICKGPINKPKEYEVVGIATVYNRSNGRELIRDATGLSPKSLATIKIVDEKVKVVGTYPDNNLI